MKPVPTRLAALAALTWLACIPFAAAQTPPSTAVTYQGRLLSGGDPVSGSLDMFFSLWNDPVAGSQVGPTLSFAGSGAVAVSDGLFSIALDFGAISFAVDQALWLQIVVNGTTLTPRQPLTATPYSLNTRGLTVDAEGRVAIGSTAAAGGLSVTSFKQNLDPMQPGVHMGRECCGYSSSTALELVADLGGAPVIDFRTLPSTGDFDARMLYDSTVDSLLVTGASFCAIGRAGIGTSNPGAALDVVGDATLRHLRVAAKDDVLTPLGAFLSLDATPTSGGNEWLVYSSGGTSGSGQGSLNFLNYTQSIFAMSLRPNGNVGIGTTNPGGLLDLMSSSQSLERIRLSGHEFYQSGQLSNDGVSLLLGVNRNGNRQLWIADSARLERNATNPVIRIIPGGGVDAIGTDGVTPLNLTLQGHTGRVGIGTIAPSNKLSVVGDADFAGNVGIGTSAPTNKLSVAGNANFTGDVGIGGAPFAGIKLNVVGSLNCSATGSFDFVTCSSGMGANSTILAYEISPDEDAMEGRLISAAGAGAGVRGHQGPSSAAWGVYSEGDIGANGDKLFQIDHPLDPTRKYLNHRCTEGPEPYNVYSGSVTSDSSGVAWVDLPSYFEALNRDYRYQLTVADESDEGFVQAKVWRKIDKNRFAIRTSRPNVEVYWQVTGVRNDPASKRSQAAKPVEQLKVGDAIGKYLRPELYGQPPELAERPFRKPPVSARDAKPE